MADNQDYDDDLTIEEQLDEIQAETLDRKSQGRNATLTLPDLMVRLALTPAQAAKLRQDRTTCMIIHAPRAEWVSPLERAPKRLGEWKYVYAAKELIKRSLHNAFPGEQAVYALTTGGRVLGVSQDPFNFLPKAMTGSADIVLKIDPPDNEIIRETIKLATGR